MSETIAKFKEFKNELSVPSQTVCCATNESESKVNETNGTATNGDLSTPDLTKAIVPISTTLPSKILRLQLQQRQQSLQHHNIIAVSENGEHIYTINDHCDLIDLSNSGDSTASVSEEEDELKPLPKEHISQVQAPVLNEITNDYYNHSLHHHHHHHHHHSVQQQHYLQGEQMQRRGSIEGKFEQPMPVKAYQPNAAASANGNNLDSEFRSQVSEIDTLDPSEIPDDKFSEEIVEQVEYYFSNESILKDAFLLKHVRRNKEGFVSLKLISSFKRVRQLTKDWRVVGHAVRRKGKTVELNDECSKVRRIDPLPNFDETMPSRTIVATDLPLDKLTIEKVSDIFSKCGEIALIRILKPGMAIPVDVRQFMNKYPEMQQKECALVEYVDSASARNAKNLQGNFQVYDMVAPKKKTGKKAVTAPVAKMVDNYKNFNYEHAYERARGGSFSGNIPSSENDLRFKLRRNHSDFHMKTDNLHHHTHSHNHHVQPQQQPQHFVHHAINHCHNLPRTNPMESGNAAPTNMNFYASSPRRFSGITESMNSPRRYSTCSTDGYSTCSEVSRRPSNCSIEGAEVRRDSGCSENCPCLSSRRGSQNTEPYRKLSHGSDSDCSQRRFSNGSFQFERTYSNGNNDMVMMPRRQSNDFNFTRKPSADINSGLMMDNENFHHTYRRFSNNFDPKSKLAGYELYNGRRISSDSGYDRRYSFGSDFEGSPRSRTGSFLNSYKNGNMGEFDGSPRSRTGSFLNAIHKAENVVRSPIGPDGSKGFGTRARKFGQIVAPVN